MGFGIVAVVVVVAAMSSVVVALVVALVALALAKGAEHIRAVLSRARALARSPC